MKKKTLQFFLTVVIIVCLASCGGKKQTGTAAGAQGTGKTELTAWCWTEDFNLYAIREANKVYQKDHPNVNVTPIDVPSDDVQSKLIAALSARQTSSLPDIILMQDTAAQKNLLTFPGAFYDMTDKVNFSNFAPFKVAVSTINNRHYGMPFDSGVGGYFMRTDYIAQAGLSVEDFNNITWEQFIELGKRVKAATGKTMVSLQDNSLDLTTMILQSSGEWYFTDDGKPNIANNNAIKAAINIVKAMYDAGIVLPIVDWNEYCNSLIDGSTTGTLNAVWMVSIITAAKENSGKWGVAKFPRLSGFPNARNGTSNGGSGWLIPASSPNAEIAVDFLDKTFNGSVAFYDTILPSAGAVATWAPAAASPIYKQPVEFFGGQPIYADIVSWGADVPPIFTGMYIYEAQDAVSKAFSEIMNGANINAALKAAEETVAFLMQE
jgi:lactose/L-arabinose transport system substrate-binding protein